MRLIENLIKIILYKDINIPMFKDYDKINMVDICDYSVFIEY